MRPQQQITHYDTRLNRDVAIKVPEAFDLPTRQVLVFRGGISNDMLLHIWTFSRRAVCG